MSWFSKRQALTSINHYSRKDSNHHIKGSDTAANRRTLVIVPIAVDIDDRLGSGRLDRFTTTTDTEMDLNTAANWDTVTPADYTVPVTRAGKDFYIYACIQAGNTPKLLLSAASTYPSGYDANNSRKIGGFHALPGACTSLPAGHPYIDFEQGAIHFNSIWDLLDKPRSAPEGMAKISLTPSDGRPALWCDIYLASGTGTTPTSVFGATIKDSVSKFSFNEYGRLQAKRLLTNQEFTAVAAGSNETTVIAGAADPTTVTFPLDTAGRSMISYYGIIGCCGIMRQFLDDITYLNKPSGTHATSAQTATAYHVASPGGNQLYLKYDTVGRAYLCCNMATDTADKRVVAGSYHVYIVHDANANTGLPIYIDHDAYPSTLKMCVNNTITGVNEYIPTENPDYSLIISHNANAASVGVAISYDDGSDERLEATLPGSANATIYVAEIATGPDYQNPGQSKGFVYAQGTYGFGTLMAGGAWAAATAAYCGSQFRLLSTMTVADTNIGARFCSDPA